MRIRPALPRDLTAVDALLARSYPILLKNDYLPSVLVTALPLISRAQPSLMRCGTYFLAEGANGALLAAGGWTRGGQAGFSTTAHIRHVITDHRHVRQGIGRRLMQHALAVARLAGIRRLECQSTLTAVPFYAALGFEILGPISIDLRPGIRFPAVAMRLRLAGA